MFLLQPKRLLTCALLVLSSLAIAFEFASWQKQRDTLVSIIKDDVKETVSYIGKAQLNEQVMQQIRTVPRHKFVPLIQQPFSYQNRPLNIGYGQTISQPYIVALMTDLLEPDKDDVVLEVGTGSAYQAAVLAGLVKHVYTLEIIPPLAEQAKKRLASMGYDNVTAKQGDGYYGWEDSAPFDSIIVTAASGQIPPPLIKQLRAGGKMIIPVGNRFFTQYLMLIEKSLTGEVTVRQILPVRFVPLTGDH